MLVNIKGADTPMGKLMALAMGGAGAKKRPVDKLCDKLNEKGFEAFVYESPLDKMMKQVEAGGKFDMNLYFAGKNAISEFVSGQDLVISFFDVQGGHPTFGMSKGGGEIPWYVHELPVVGISVNKPTMLADAPMLRTYINTYDSGEDTLNALETAVTGRPYIVGDRFSAADCAALVRESALAAMRESLEATQVTAAHVALARSRVRPSLDPTQVEWLANYADQQRTR
jgi:hypothetical protein